MSIITFETFEQTDLNTSNWDWFENREWIKCNKNRLHASTRMCVSGKFDVICLLTIDKNCRNIAYYSPRKRTPINLHIKMLMECVVVLCVRVIQWTRDVHGHIIVIKDSLDFLGEQLESHANWMVVEKTTIPLQRNSNTNTTQCHRSHYHCKPSTPFSKRCLLSPIFVTDKHSYIFPYVFMRVLELPSFYCVAQKSFTCVSFGCVCVRYGNPKKHEPVEISHNSQNVFSFWFVCLFVCLLANFEGCILHAAVSRMSHFRIFGK